MVLVNQRYCIQLYGNRYIASIFLYAIMAMLGYCITLIYYRSNKILKYAVSVTPALLLFVLVPALDRFTNGLLIIKLAKFMTTIMGFGQTINPYIAMISFIAGFGILALFSFLLIRRAVIKQ